MPNLLFRRFHFFTFLISSAICIDLRSETLYEIIVQKGESLSEIARSHFKGRLYGKDGVLQKLIDLNPELSNPNLIYPNNHIRLKIKEPSSNVSLEVKEKSPVPTPPLEIEVVPPMPVVSFEKSYSAEVVGNYSQTTLDLQDKSTDAKAKLTTSSDFEVGVKMLESVASKWRLYQSATIRRAAFNPSDNSNKSILERTQILPHFAAGSIYQVNEMLSADLSFNYSSLLFLRGKNSNQIEIGHLWVPSLKAQMNLIIAQNQWAQFGVRGAGEYLFSKASNSYDAESGYRLTTSIFLQKEIFHGKNLSFDFGYSQRKQNTNLVDLTEKNWAGALSFKTKF